MPASSLACTEKGVPVRFPILILTLEMWSTWPLYFQGGKF